MFGDSHFVYKCGTLILIQFLSDVLLGTFVVAI